MNDRELLEMAAKAAGYKIEEHQGTGGLIASSGFLQWHPWDPLTDDGDALRLAVALRITLICSRGHTACDIPGTDEWVSEESIQAGDARRAIVRAAAEIGRAMP